MPLTDNNSGNRIGGSCSILIYDWEARSCLSVVDKIVYCARFIKNHRKEKYFARKQFDTLSLYVVESNGRSALIKQLQIAVTESGHWID